MPELPVPEVPVPGGPVPEATVLRPGLQSTVQDAGRRVRALGIPPCGVADMRAYRLANALVGNVKGEAALEVTLSGPKLQFVAGAVVAFCGAPFALILDGEPVQPNRALAVRAGQILDIGGTPRGMRAVLAVRGGLRGEVLYGSPSTDLKGGFGGVQGRALKAGDSLQWNAPEALSLVPGFLSADLLTPTTSHAVLRVLATLEATPELLRELTGRTFTVSGQADRMGVRLTQSVNAPHDPTRVSLPNVPGLLQLPPDGRPILLLPDSGTHGGYPTPLVVASVDLPRLGQLRPGNTVSFRVVDVVQATSALRVSERELQQLEGILRHLHGLPR